MFLRAARFIAVISQKSGVDFETRAIKSESEVCVMWDH